MFVGRMLAWMYNWLATSTSGKSEFSACAAVCCNGHPLFFLMQVYSALSGSSLRLRNAWLFLLAASVFPRRETTRGAEPYKFCVRWHNVLDCGHRPCRFCKDLCDEVVKNICLSNSNASRAFSFSLDSPRAQRGDLDPVGVRSSLKRPRRSDSEVGMR